MLSDIQIRTDLKAGDLSFIIGYHTEYYHRELGYTEMFEYYVAKNAVEFYERYQPDRSRIWIVEAEGRRVGSLVLLDRGSAAQLRYFILRPEVRGQGLGSQLMTTFLAFARAKGYTSVYLWTTEERAIAVNLYERFGFRLTEENPSDSFGKPLVERKYELGL